jgi:NAD(P)-dependent dehydrogenase (short-subunit alcohol dehydrogenase family)
LLESQIVVITGASRGIGRVMAVRFAREGARVAMVARDQARLGALATELGGNNVLALAADVCDRKAMDVVCRRVLEEWGAPHLVVANAGQLDPIGPIWETDPEIWWKDVEVNLRGSFLSARGFLPAMVEAGRGRVVLFGGGGSTGVFPWVSAYSMSKAAILRLAETIDLELTATGVRAFSVSPGFVRTDMTERFANTTAGRKYVADLAERLDRDESTPPEACAELLVQIASGRLDALHGRFLHAGVDLDHLDALCARANQIADQEERVLTLKGFSL